MTHITIEREALQTVLDTLEENHHLIEQYERSECLALYDRQITVIKQALAAPTVQEPVKWSDYEPDGRRYPAVPDALTSADIQEHIEYVAGWNDCRQAMLEMMK